MLLIRPNGVGQAGAGNHEDTSSPRHTHERGQNVCESLAVTDNSLQQPKPGHHVHHRTSPNADTPGAEG